MSKNNIILLSLIFCSSCMGIPGCPSIYQSESLSSNTKTFLCGSGGYKYKCKKAGDCCEIGKNCEEDIKNKEVEK